MTLVIDASVLVPALVPQSQTENAIRWLEHVDPLIAPDLIYVEAANALWKYAVFENMAEVDVDRAYMAMQTEAIEIIASRDLIGPALALARRLRHPVYDCMYIALAESTGAILVTGDRRQLRAAEAAGLALEPAWIGDAPPTSI